MLASWPRLAAAELESGGHNDGATLDQETWKAAAAEQDGTTLGHGAPGHRPVGSLPGGVISQLCLSEPRCIWTAPKVARLGGGQMESCHTWSPADFQYVWTAWTLQWNVSAGRSLATSGCPTAKEHPDTQCAYSCATFRNLNTAARRVI